MSGVPILYGHDFSRTIGRVEFTVDGQMCARFSEDIEITREQFFEIFGNVGARFEEFRAQEGGPLRIRAGTILEFSFCVTPHTTQALVDAIRSRGYVMSEAHGSGYRVVVGFSSQQEASALHDLIARTPTNLVAGDGDAGA